MTNEQKARQLLQCSPMCEMIGDKCRIGDCNNFQNVIAMAQWKDNLFKTELNKMLNRFNDEESIRAYFATETLNELYNNLFPNG